MAIDFPNSPTVGQVFQGWQWDGTKWVSVGGGAASGLNNIGRNIIQNPYFNVQQRGSGPWTVSGAYTADRWKLYVNLDTDSVSIGTLADADRAAIGDEAARYFLQNTFTGTAGGLSVLYQLTEGVRRLGGKTVTVSLWAKCSAGALKLGVSIDQSFGTGGSPSATVVGTVTTLTLSTVWARYNVTVTLPSTAGKTLGTNGDDTTACNFFMSSTGIGVQSGSIQLWGVQLEIGSVATPLEKVDPGEDVLRCQRFYQAAVTSAAGLSIAGYAVGAGNNIFQQIFYPTTMRATPTAALSFAGGAVNISANGVGSPSSSKLEIYLTAGGGGIMYAVLNGLTLSADL